MMPPIEVGAISAVHARLARAAGGDVLPGANGPTRGAEAGEARSTASPAVEASAALDPGEPPVDSDRVAMIRKAVENGTYPVIPTQIADAIIAAGMLLRSPEA